MSVFDNMDDMYVTKRNGSREIVSFDKILQRIKKIGRGTPLHPTGLSPELDIKINYTSLAMKIIDQLFDGITTTQIDELSAEQCAALSSTLPEYNVLAGRLAISNHHKSTPNSFTKAMKKLYGNVDKHGKPYPLISEAFYKVVLDHGKTLDALCDYSRDYLIDYFGFKTLERSYLFRIRKTIVERPQHMWLRVAIGLHDTDLPRVEETYHAMSQKYFTHATPTLFNAGTPRPQLSSCFLQAMESDSIEGIYNTVKDCAMISKWAGGIGLHIHNIRAEGSHINGTNGSSNGIVPMLRVFNHTAKYVDQCLDPDTLVYTARGAIPIKNIVIGDEVVTDDGQLNKVGKVLDYNDYFGDLYSIKLAGSIYPMKMTDMHPMWCIQPQRMSGHDNILKALDAQLIAPQFVEIKNIWKGDYVGFPIPTYERDIAQYTEDDCRFYGIMLGDGNISPDKNLAYVALNKTTKQDTILFVEEYLRKLNIHITYSYANDHYLRLVWSRNNMFKFTYEMLYDDKKEKCVIPHMLHLPKAKISQVVKGILETDGKVKDYQVILEITSHNIIESVRYMLMRLGTLTSGFLRDRRGESHVSKYGSTITCRKTSYALNIPKTRVVCDLFPNKQLTECTNIRTFFEYKGYLYSRVTALDKTENYSGRVIDIEIDNDDHHNFLTMNGHVMNGGGKRNGSFAIYLEPWHADVEKFLQMKKNHGDEELKARDLFYALWIPDLFMKRVKENGTWTLMCPDECPGLSDVYGDEFETLYTQYEQAGKGRKTMEARKLWYQILDAQAETSTPYMLSKDNMNRKSNQKNLGTIKSSNLCTEICLYSDSQETAVCNLASIGLPTFVDTTTTPHCAVPTFNFEKLHAITRIVTYNLNRVVDINYYPTEKTERSNRRHRPLGIGIQGLADTFFLMGYAFASPEARKLNRDIFETMYHAALTESCALAQTEGVYETYPGSPISQGILQFDMWEGHLQTNERYDWDALRAEIRTHGVRNSTLLAPMPTASTSQILGFNECFEPITSNIYSRRTLAGEFIVTNKYLMRDLIRLGIWNEQVKNQIIQHQGSIQTIAGIPDELKDKYKTVWEMKMKDIIDMSADRGVYICQSQSLNLWVAQPNYNNLTAMYFYAFDKGLKTLQYYLRRQAAHQAQQFTIEPEKATHQTPIQDDDEEEEGCVMCSG